MVVIYLCAFFSIIVTIYSFGPAPLPTRRITVVVVDMSSVVVRCHHLFGSFDLLYFFPVLQKWRSVGECHVRHRGFTQIPRV